MFRRAAVLALLVIPVSSFAQKKEILDMQRDIGMLHDQVGALKSSFDEKMGAITALLQQNTDAQKDLLRQMTVLETRLNEKLSQSGAPMASMSSKFDQMGSDFQAMREQVTDMVSRLGKVEQKLVTLSSDIRSVQTAPPPPPAGSTGPAGATGAPPIPADTLYENAYRDKMGGKPDLALQEFQEYLRLYGSTERAPNAQFWVGQIYFDQGDNEKALEAFDAVIEKYDENNKTPDAMLMKGKTLQRMGRKNDAVTAYRKLYSQYTKSEAGQRACTELKAMAFNCVAAPMQKRKTR